MTHHLKPPPSNAILALPTENKFFSPSRSLFPIARRGTSRRIDNPPKHFQEQNISPVSSFIPRCCSVCRERYIHTYTPPKLNLAVPSSGLNSWLAAGARCSTPSIPLFNTRSYCL